MTRDELIHRTRQLLEEGQRLQAQPSLGALTVWLQLSDDLLSAAWGSMDRYHLAWLMVGKPADTVRGRPMTETEEAAYVREVAAQKTAALRMSLDAVERQGMPFVGEDGGVGTRQGTGEVPETAPSTGDQAGGGGDVRAADESSGPVLEPVREPPATLQGARVIAVDPVFAERLAEARRQATEHAAHERRAPRPEKMQR